MIRNAQFHRMPVIGGLILSVVTSLLSLCCAPAWAEPADYIDAVDYVEMPNVVRGEREIEFRAGTLRLPESERERVFAIGFGYAPTDYWMTELNLKYSKEGSDSTRYEAVEWENVLQLTEPGEYAVDLGLMGEIEVPRDHAEGIEYRTGLLAQKVLGGVQLNGNLLFFHTARNEELKDTEMGYQWQAKYRWRPEFEYGLQGFGELGKWNRWDSHDEQTHRAGPAVFGMARLGGRRLLRYNAAWLIGMTSGAPDHSARLQAEYEF